MSLLPLPIELFHHILDHITDTDDLITLSTLSSTFRPLAEGKLWSITTLVYDDPSKHNLNLLEYLARHAGMYVRHLEIDYARGSSSGSGCSKEDNKDEEEMRKQVVYRKSSLALQRMLESNLVHVDIYGLGDIPASLLFSASSSSSNNKIHTIKYAGASSSLLFSFLQSPHCPHLSSLTFSNNLEPSADYSLLRLPWKALTTFSGNILHTASILRSSSPSLRDLTVHLNPSNMSLRKGWDQVGRGGESVEIFGVGDLNGYPPVYLDHVLTDLGDGMKHFPWLKELRRVPFHEQLNKQKILSLLSSASSQSSTLTYISFLDYNPEIRTDRGIKLARELARICPWLETVVMCPCPNKEWAFVYSRYDTENEEEEWRWRRVEVDRDETIL